MEQRKRMSSKEKMMILRELLENKVQIGELSEKYGIHSNVIYNCSEGMPSAEKNTF